MVVVASANENGDSGGDHVLDLPKRILTSMVADGLLRPHERERMVIPTYFRTDDELAAPCDGALGAALALEEHLVVTAPDPLFDEYERTGDAAAYAHAFTGWLRAFSEPSLFSVLDR